jgi:predicted secreted protein
MIEVSFVFGVAIYGIVWFLTLFMVLPFGVRTQGEAGSVEPGSAHSAPDQPALGKRLLITTLIALVFFVGVYWVLTSPTAAAWLQDFGPNFTKP